MSSDLVRKRAISISILSIGLMALSSLSTNNLVSAESTSGSVKLSTTINESISMSITGNADGTDCTNEGFDSCSTFGNLLPNQYATASSLISVYTNSSDGYSLSVKADNHADLQTESGSSIPAGTLTGETGGQGIWSYKTDGTGIKTNWTPMTTTDTTIKGTSIYSATTSDTTVTYGLSTSSNQAAGDYSTTLIYTATAPNSTDVKEPTLTINLGEGIYGAQIKTDTLAGESTGLVTISENGTIRTGTVKINTDKNYYIIPLYESGYTLNTITPTGGTITQDNDNAYGYYYYTPNANVDNIITITGKTLPTEITATSGSNLTAMQSINSSNASSYCPAVPTAVKDSRDDSVYYIQTLADGNCWMLENLRLVGGTTLTSADSNVETAYTIPMDSWSSTYTEGRVNSTYNTTTVAGYGAGRNYTGTYYNYCAVSAGTKCTDSSTHPGHDKLDVCPANWTMPTSGGSSQYYNVVIATIGSGDTMRTLAPGYNITGWFDDDMITASFVLSATYSGYIRNNRMYSQGRNYSPWSSTVINSTYIRMFEIYVNTPPYLSARNFMNFRDDGNIVRCVLQQ